MHASAAPLGNPPIPGWDAPSPSGRRRWSRLGPAGKPLHRGLGSAADADTPRDRRQRTAHRSLPLWPTLPQVPRPRTIAVSVRRRFSSSPMPHRPASMPPSAPLTPTGIPPRLTTLPRMAMSPLDVRRNPHEVSRQASSPAPRDMARVFLSSHVTGGAVFLKQVVVPFPTPQKPASPCTDGSIYICPRYPHPPRPLLLTASTHSPATPLTTDPLPS